METAIWRKGAVPESYVTSYSTPEMGADVWANAEAGPMKATASSCSARTKRGAVMI